MSQEVRRETKRRLVKKVTVLTVKLPDSDFVFIWEIVLEWVSHRPLVVRTHDGLHGRRMCETDGVAKLVYCHGEQVHAMRICRHRTFALLQD